PPVARTAPEPPPRRVPPPPPDAAPAPSASPRSAAPLTPSDEAALPAALRLDRAPAVRTTGGAGPGLSDGDDVPPPLPDAPSREARAARWRQGPSDAPRERAAMHHPSSNAGPGWDGDAVEARGGANVATIEAAPRAPVAAQPTGAHVPELHRVVGAWDEVIESLRTGGKRLLAEILARVEPVILARVEPVAVTAAGVVTLRLEQDDDRSMLEEGMATVRQAVLGVLPGVTGLQLAAPRGGAPAGAGTRITRETVVRDRIETMVRAAPLLGAAIESLDLDLLE
ncbi:MAG: hypothetical protein MUF21_03070, partial [Gemmatimonadaceae bacterium]|nr:hypothetical protein [Gemmatimonadaceae bacterium]